MEAYSPYDVVSDPAAFGLFAADRPTALGDLRVYAGGPTEHGVVFLHGVGQSWDCWTPVLRAARDLGIDTSTWIFVDLPGFGGSADLPGPVRLPEVGEAVLAGLAAHGLREVELVGHSMGGFLALDLMARRTRTPAVPLVTGGVVLSGAYAGIVEFVNRPWRVLRKRPALTTAWTGLWAGSFLGAGPARLVARSRLTRRMFGSALGLVAAHPDRLPDSFVRSLLTEVRPRSFRIAARTGKHYDCVGTWSQIAVPFTAVFGERDRLVDATDRRVLEAACPFARVEVLADTGHFTPVERPHDVARLLAS